MSPLLASVLVGLFGFTLYGLATVLMKYGAAAIAHPRTMFATRESTRQAVVWIVGCVTNFVYVGILTVALGLGHASVVSALTGFGLVVMALLSYFFLGERLSRMELAGIAVVVLGVTVVGWFGTAGEAAGGGFELRDLLVFQALVLAGSGLAAAATLLNRLRLAGVLFGAVAGGLAGASMVLQKVFIDPVMQQGLGGWDVVWALASSVYVYVFIVISMGAFVMLQVAYQYGRAVQVVPAMVSFMIVVPILGGLMVFGESLEPPQLVGTAAVVAGVILLSAFEKPAAAPAAATPATDLAIDKEQST